MIVKVVVTILLSNILLAGFAQSPRTNITSSFTLTKEVAEHLSTFPLKCIVQEFPNKPSNVLERASDAQEPKQLHPSFYGCFDWHSSVHGHWMLVRLLKTFPDLNNGATIRAVLQTNFSRENIDKETAYFALPINATYERMYGWAWLLKLVEELHTWNDAAGKKWEQNLQPLTDLIVKRTMSFLPKQNYPIRQGMHPNTAFALAFVYDYAKTVGNDSLLQLVTKRSSDYYGNDKDAPLAWEPSGSDFLSPALEEADLMRRVLKPADYRSWLKRFFPTLGQVKPANILKPVVVTDRSDLQLVHLDGLNTSRAWCMFGIANAIGKADPLYSLLMQSADEQLGAAFGSIATGNYGGEHWLASFMLYALEARSGVK